MILLVEVGRSFLSSHDEKVGHTGSEIVRNCWEMFVGDSLAETEFSNYRCNKWVVCVLDPWEEMVLYLIIQTAIHET